MLFLLLGSLYQHGEDGVEAHKEIMTEAIVFFPVEDIQDEVIKKDIRLLIDELIVTIVTSNCKRFPHQQQAQLEAASCKYYRCITLYLITLTVVICIRCHTCSTYCSRI